MQNKLDAFDNIQHGVRQPFIFHARKNTFSIQHRREYRIHTKCNGKNAHNRFKAEHHN